MTEKDKDIIFNVNKYDQDSDEFKPIYNSEKINKRCKLCVYFEEKSLYQIEFDNKYSWLNSKEVNFTISLLKITDKTEKKELKNENNEENDENNINNEENNKIIKIIMIYFQ